MVKSTRSNRSQSELLDAVEADLDSRYHSTAIAHPNRTIALWYLLTVVEDFFRGLFSLTEDADARVVEFQVDAQKYSVRFAMDRIRREMSDTSPTAIPRRVVPKLYLKTSELLHAGIEFKAASQLCSAARAGTLNFVELDTAIEITFDEAQHDKRYAALELLGHFPLGMVDHTANLYMWIRNPELRPRALGLIAESTQIRDRAVGYSYDVQLAAALASELTQPASIVPADWRFPWGGSRETILLTNALCVRCLYHLVAVHFGSAHHGLRGGGEASLLHVTTMPRLISDIQDMCSLDVKAIQEFITYLTYGRGTSTPDPALQPIVHLASGVLGLPCVLYLSSNYERNLLGLQARIDRRAFDGQSNLFEREMVAGLLTELAPRWPLLKGNVRIREQGRSEEIDLLVADQTTKTLLACELRWMLQPGDPREVQQRKAACCEKVPQLARKVDWLVPRVHAGLAALGILKDDPDGWSVEGVVVIKTFGGTLSPDQRYPILTEDIFIRGMKGASSLRQFAMWSQSLGWLPQEGRHFRVVPQDLELSVLGKRLTALGIEKLSSLHEYSDFVHGTLGSVPTTPEAQDS